MFNSIFGWGAKPEPTPQRLEPLIEDLKSEDSEVRGRAAFRMAQGASIAAVAVPALAECLWHKAALVRASATYSLWRIESSPVVLEPSLVKLLKKNKSRSRYCLCEAPGAAAAKVENKVGEMNDSELLEALNRWRNWLTQLDAFDNDGAFYPVILAKSKAAVRRLVEALRAAQAGKVAPGSSR